MAADRPEKKAIREIWLKEVEERDSAKPPVPVPLYFTLPGARGGDVAAMVERGLVPVEETGAISDPEQMRIVAVEQSPGAVVELQGRFPGLKVLEQPLTSLLRNTGPFLFPDGKHERFCRAQVVNMDLNETLRASIQQGQLEFPALALVRKFAMLHAKEPQIDWTLCLTLDARIEGWGAEIDKKVCRFLASNFSADQVFSDQAREVLGTELHGAIVDKPDGVNVRDRSVDDQQRVLMVLVPKKIAHDAHGHGWHVDTVENLRYGGADGRARMLTWILRMTWDDRATSEPQTVYHEALRLVLQRCGFIDHNGNLTRP